jgi:hypothetical protein
MASVNNTRIKLKRRRSSMINDSLSNSPGYSPRVQKLAEKHKREKDNVFKMFKTKRAIVVDNQRRNIYDVDIADETRQDDQADKNEIKVECEARDSAAENVKQEPPAMSDEAAENATNVKLEESANKNTNVFSKAFSSRLTNLKNTVKNMMSTASSTRSKSSAVETKTATENKENKAGVVSSTAPAPTKPSILPVSSSQSNALKRASSVCVNPKTHQTTKRAMTSSKTSSSSLRHFNSSATMTHSTSSLSTSAYSNMSRMSSFSSGSNLSAKPAFKVSQNVKYDDKHLYNNVGHF